ncbi:MAG TPA: hypothetical protein DET40_24655 [Lentisphaeria bacterium]|nr:hypothetical protein [Lentisphaeria bacterium]
MWNVADLDKNKKYCLQLCECDGYRDFQLTELDAVLLPACMFKTQVIPYEILTTRSLSKIEKSVRLENGEGFSFVWHIAGWMTEKEAIEFRKSGKVPFKV